MNRRRALAAIASVAIASNTHAVVLFDGSLGTRPDEQGLLSFAAAPPAMYATAGSNSTTLDTSANNGIYAGWGNATTFDLNRTTGFRVRVDLKVTSSTFTNPDRAAFSMIALSNDKTGIEIAFHADEIFAQHDNPYFVRGEVATLNTTQSIVRYDLDVLGSIYTFRVAGATVLTGSVRDYTGYTGPIDPYETPNFLFFGDDSTSAGGATEIAFIEVIVPEPRAIAMLPLLATRRRRK